MRNIIFYWKGVKEKGKIFLRERHVYHVSMKFKTYLTNTYDANDVTRFRDTLYIHEYLQWHKYKIV